MEDFEKAFMELVQLHERTWGMEQYPGRPSLTDLLSSPIVVMWTGEKKAAPPLPSSGRGVGRVSLPDEKNVTGRFNFSVCQKIEDLNDILLSMILANKIASNFQKISRIYIQHRPVKVTGIKLLVAAE